MGVTDGVGNGNTISLSNDGASTSPAKPSLSPVWKYPFEPQHRTPRVASSAQVWLWPTTTEMAGVFMLTAAPGALMLKRSPRPS